MDRERNLGKEEIKNQLISEINSLKLDINNLNIGILIFK